MQVNSDVSGGEDAKVASIIRRSSDVWSMKSWSDSVLGQLKTAYRGSKDEIGWLQREEGLPPVVDCSERFLQILARICRGVHCLPESLVYILVPGATYWLPRGMQTGPYHSLYFVATEKYLQRLGLTCHVARLSDEQSMECNAGELAKLICSTHVSEDKCVVLLAHGTGGVVATSALALHKRQLAPLVAGVVVMQCPYGGSAVVSDAMRSADLSGGHISAVLRRALSSIFKGSIQSLESLTYASRRQFILQHPLPSSTPIVSFHTSAPNPTSLLSHSPHHAEVQIKDLPRNATSLIPPQHGTLPNTVSPLPSTNTRTQGPPNLDLTNNEPAEDFILDSAKRSTDEGPPSRGFTTGEAKKVGVSFPVGATLASVAWHLERWYGAQNDGVVMRADAEVPGSAVVRPHKKLEHSWLAFGGRKKGEGETPEPPQVAEALITLLLQDVLHSSSSHS